MSSPACLAPTEAIDHGWGMPAAAPGRRTLVSVPAVQVIALSIVCGGTVTLHHLVALGFPQR